MAPDVPGSGSNDARPRQNPRVAHQVLGGKAVILNYEGKRMLGLNETGSRIWGLLDGTRTTAQICQVVADGLDLPRTEVEPDVVRFIDDLRARGLVLDDTGMDSAEQPALGARPPGETVSGGLEDE